MTDLLEGRAPRASRFPVILSGPSGAGKTTIRDRLLAGPDRDHFVFSVSLTTRDPRSSEVDGVDYGFVPRARFEELVERGDMLEHATVHGELYGTPRRNLVQAAAADTHLLLDIDVQGARQVRAAVDDVLSIFLVPPTGARIIERLRGRGSETAVQLARRLESARAELEAAPEFDYLVVNDDLDEAVGRVAGIIRGEGSAVDRLGETATDFVAGIVRELDRI